MLKKTGGTNKKGPLRNTDTIDHMTRNQNKLKNKPEN
jgi:hypothetical protein